MEYRNWNQKDGTGQNISTSLLGYGCMRFPTLPDGSIDEVSGFLSDNGYTFPVVMDTTGDVLSAYGISAFPTTFMIDTEGNVFGYVTGQLTADMMESIVTQTMTGQRVS